MFDAFEELPGYGNDAKSTFLGVTEAAVRHNFAKYGLLDDGVVFHRGLFLETLPAFRKAADEAGMKLAILRIDGNFYDSYADALYHLYELVPVGGIVIFDGV